MSRLDKLNPAWRAIAFAGLVSGTLDILAAIGQYALRDVPPMRILQSIASGLLGSAAYSGGVATAGLGLLLHFTIAAGAAAVYYVASKQMPFLERNAAGSGLLYGIVVYGVMNFIVLPLSQFPGRQAFNLESALPQIAIHMLFVGLPIALVIRFYRRKRFRGADA